MPFSVVAIIIVTISTIPMVTAPCSALPTGLCFSFSFLFHIGELLVVDCVIHELQRGIHITSQHLQTATQISRMKQLLWPMLVIHVETSTSFCSFSFACAVDNRIMVSSVRGVMGSVPPPVCCSDGHVFTRNQAVYNNFFRVESSSQLLAPFLIPSCYRDQLPPSPF